MTKGIANYYGVAAGLSGQLTIGEETTYGSYASSYARGLRFISESLRLQHAVLQQGSLQGDRRFPLGPRRAVVTRQVSGQIVTEVARKGFGLLFSHMLGSSAIAPQGETSTVAHLQTHTPGPLLGKSLTIQKGVPAADCEIEPFTTVGSKIGGWTLDFEAGMTLILSLQIDACDMIRHTSSSNLVTPSYGYDGSDLIHFMQGTISKNGTRLGGILGGKLFADNGLDNNDFRLDNGALKLEPWETGLRSAGGLVNVEWRTTDGLYDAFLGDTGCAVVLDFEGDVISGTYKYFLKITLPDCRLLGETPVVDDAGIVTSPLPFIVCDKGDSSAPIKIEYQSTDATY